MAGYIEIYVFNCNDSHYEDTKIYLFTSYDEARENLFDYIDRNYNIRDFPRDIQYDLKPHGGMKFLLCVELGEKPYRFTIEKHKVML